MRINDVGEHAGRLVAVALALWIGGTWPARGGEPAAVDYLRQVKPILKQRCYACHGALKQKAGLRLDTAAALRKGGDGGPAVEPGRADESELIDRVTQIDPKLRMPPEGAPLSVEQVGLLRAWVAQGARAPAGEQPEDDPRRHWAFLPAVRPEVPRVANASWVRNPIDAFVAAGHERRALSPSRPAPPEVLLRRVYLDLTGLPPTREELHAFLQDPSDEAYARVVERLLASPSYGERWARHWMDVWRYSDWYGRRAVPDVTNSYAMIWRWRDWIVRALNDDRGYDRMVLAMLAADELTPADDAEVVATGFVLRNFYRWNYNLWMKDSVEHTAKAFLGLTIQCAHCHDHKYDPLTQTDYFAFRAFFEPLEVRHDRVPGEPDPGPFPKYVYGSAYGPIKSGMARVFDENLDAKTYIYTRGESRNVLPGRPPVEPSPPAFLRPKAFRITPVSLPAEAYYPGSKAFVRAEELRACETSLSAAEAALAVASRQAEAARTASDALATKWLERESPRAFVGLDEVRAFAPPPAQSAPPEVAKGRDAAEVAGVLRRVAAQQVELERAKLDSLCARIAADRGRDGNGPGDGKALARAASKAGRSIAVAQARLDLARVVLELVRARIKVRDDPKAAPEVLKCEQRRELLLKTVAAAEAALKPESESYTLLSPVYPSRSTGRRSALARWIASRENPLTARVAVNHIWRWHVQTPLVATTHDLGRNGKRPTNPELLDWLAVELMEPSTPGVAPWSMKHLHRLIVTSATYRMRSDAPDPRDPNRARDPENAALWYVPPARMEAEVVRDSVLHAAGRLDRTFGGPDIDFDQGLTGRRRSLYFTHHGEARMPFLELFDAPDACDAYVRTVSVVPQQALALTNSELVRASSRTLAERLWDAGAAAPSSEPVRTCAFVTAAFEQVLGRGPTGRERDAVLAFLARQSRLLAAAANDPDPAATARADLVQALFSHNDFVTVH